MNIKTVVELDSGLTLVHYHQDDVFWLIDDGTEIELGNADQALEIIDKLVRGFRAITPNAAEAA